MTRKLFVSLFLASALLCLAAKPQSDDRITAAHLAKMAKKAQNSGQTVRAFMLYSEASARDPQNSSYRENRDALAPAAKLLVKENVQNADISSDLLTAEKEAKNGPPIERISAAEWEGPPLSSLPHLRFKPGVRDFDLRLDAKSLVEQVAASYGVRTVVNGDVDHQKQLHFELRGADFRSAMDAVTAATNTFVFPVTDSIAYFAPDTESKRNDLEPVVALTFPLPEASSEKDLIDAANGVRALLNMRTIGWDSQNRMVLVRDKVTRAEIARALLESLLMPRGQISFEVQFLAVESDRNYHWGASLQTLYQLIDFGNLGGLKSVLPSAVGSSVFGTFGGGATLFGVGIADSELFATYTKTNTQAFFDATVVVSDRGTATLHIGDKYPIATSLYTGSSTAESSIYNPAPQITMEDLGLELKMTPHMNGEGDIDVDLEAQYRTLGTIVIDTVPSIAERSYKGSVSMKEGQYAIIAGLNAFSESSSVDGIAGISSIPGLNQLLSEHTHDKQSTNVLLVIKPTVTRLPVTDGFSPEFLLGSRRGQRVLL